jgi:hypothetical protein
MAAAAVAMTAAATQASKNVRMAAIPLDASVAELSTGFGRDQRQIVGFHHIVTEPCQR